MAALIRQCSRPLTTASLALFAIVPSSPALGIESGTVFQYAQVEHDARGTEPEAHSEHREPGTVYGLGPGDRLRVTFHERQDLSGEFRVRPDGLVSLPFVGTLQAEGKPVAQIETDIADAYYRATKQTAYVSVEVVEWRPVYVVGFVNKPGAYPFAPGIGVLHAVAIAGGTFRPAGLISPIELSRETWQGENARHDLERALARLARVKAQRDDLEAVETPDELITLAGRERAERLMAAKERIFQFHRTAALRRANYFHRMERLARDEIDAQKKQLESLREEEVLRRKDLQETAQLRDRGLTSRTLLYNAQYGLSAHMANISEVIAEIAKAERTLAQIGRDRTAFKVQDWQNAQDKINAIEKEIEDLKRTIRTSEETARLMNGTSIVPATDRLSAWNLNYRIMRRDGNGYKTLAAAADTQLLPGDVLHVSRASAPAGPGENEGMPSTLGRNGSTATRSESSSLIDEPDGRQPER